MNNVIKYFIFIYFFQVINCRGIGSEYIPIINRTTNDFNVIGPVKQITEFSRKVWDSNRELFRDNTGEITIFNFNMDGYLISEQFAIFSSQNDVISYPVYLERFYELNNMNELIRVQEYFKKDLVKDVLYHSENTKFKSKISPSIEVNKKNSSFIPWKYEINLSKSGDFIVSYYDSNGTNPFWIKYYDSNFILMKKEDIVSIPTIEMYENSLLVKRSNEKWEEEYIYDERNLLSKIVKKNLKEDYTLNIEFENIIDSHGNWTEQIAFKISNDGYKIPLYKDVRIIEYY